MNNGLINACHEDELTAETLLHYHNGHFRPTGRRWPFSVWRVQIHFVDYYFVELTNRRVKIFIMLLKGFNIFLITPEGDLGTAAKSIIKEN